MTDSNLHLLNSFCSLSVFILGACNELIFFVLAIVSFQMRITERDTTSIAINPSLCAARSHTLRIRSVLRNVALAALLRKAV